MSNETTNILTRGRITTANSTLAIGGVSAQLNSFVVAESSVLRTNFYAEKPTHRQSAKRLALTLKDDTTENKRPKNMKDKMPTLLQNQKRCNQRTKPTLCTTFAFFSTATKQTA